MRVLVTGGAGFIGSHLVDALVGADHQVRVLDNLSTGRRENLAPWLDRGSVELVEGLVTAPDTVEAAVHGCELVYHLAAAIGVRYVIDDPLGGMLTNIRGTEYVLEAACRHGARVVLASSSEVYGKGGAGGGKGKREVSDDVPAGIWAPFREDDDSRIGPTSIPRWWYALSKALDEHLGFAYWHQHALPVSAVRYFNVYGPRCLPGGYGVLARFISQALRAEPLSVFGDGAQTRSFTYVSDAVRATVLAGTQSKAVGEAFNVGSAGEIAINDLARLVLRLTGSASPIHHQEHEQVFGGRFEDTRRRVPDTSKIERLLGFRAGVSLEEGIGSTARWWAADERLRALA